MDDYFEKLKEKGNKLLEDYIDGKFSRDELYRRFAKLGEFMGETSMDKIVIGFDKNWDAIYLDTLHRASENNTSSFAMCVIKPDLVDVILQKLHELVDTKVKPKDVMEPIRAAMDAGVIRRPTWAEFRAEFGENKLKQKSSLTKYENYEYAGEDFKVMVEEFRMLLKER